MTQSREEWVSTPADPDNLVEDVGNGVGIVSPDAVVAGAPIKEQRIMAVIVRACEQCGAKRSQVDDGRWLCPDGHDSGDVIDLGVINAQFANPLKQAAWRLIGSQKAKHRTKQANKRLR